ncbi:hypothetical protein B7494_g4952 [Chlorociboria aeruginascens]|nr:hypothetical protein B7494_g4952 [Chlorociboria aeruginascens]
MKTIKITQVVRKPKDRQNDASSEKILVSCEGKEVEISLSDPFSVTEEAHLRWYLEKYAHDEPFEISKAEEASRALLKYGHSLSDQLISSGLVPRKGDLHLEIGIRKSKKETDDPEIGWGVHRLHWEILADTSKWSAKVKLDSVTITRTISTASLAGLSGSKINSKAVFNILLVVSRPLGRDDIASQLVSEPLVDVVSALSKESNTHVNVNILRPPSWQAFKEHLQIEHEPGHYQLVHFDMHGTISDAGTSKAKAQLAFSKTTPRKRTKTKADFRSSDEIANVLVKSGVRNVILSACESASTSSGTESSNLAEVFLRAGIPFVLAFRYQVNEEAVEIFMKRFYRDLLAKRENIARAAQNARLALVKDSGRRARFRHEVHLEDYIISVVYQNIDTDPFVLPKSKSSLKDKLLQKMSTQRAVNGKPFDLVGRDAHILELELLLVSQKLIFLYGQGGCGKTTFLQYCAWWWKTTSWIENAVYLDLYPRSFGFNDLLKGISDTLDIAPDARSVENVIAILQNRNTLLVIDSADLDAARVPESDQAKMKDFLARASQGQSIVIISSRKSSSILADVVPMRNDFCLACLPMPAAMQYAENLVFKIHSRPEKPALRDRESLNYFDRTLILLDRNPLAIKLVFSTLGKSFKPEVLFRNLLYGHKVAIDQATVKDARFISQMRRSLFLHSLDTGVFRPETLSLFWNVMPQDLRSFYWFVMLPMLKDEVRRTYEEITLANWEDERFLGLLRGSLKNLGYETKFQAMINGFLHSSILTPATMKRPNGSTADAYHINPVFTLLIRELLTENLRPIIQTAFVHSYIIGQGLMTEEIDSVPRIFWDDEAQHQDHSTNNLMVAFTHSLDEDIVAEIERHGLSTTEILMKPIGQTFFTDRRTWELARSAVKVQVIRLTMLPAKRGNTPFDYEYYEVSHLLSIARLLVESEDNESEQILDNSLKIAGIWNYKGEEYYPDLELSWFQLKHAHGLFVMGREGPLAGKRIFEKNLETDPKMPSHHELFNAIRRSQFANLQQWIICVVELRKMDDPNLEGEIAEAAKAFGGAFKPGKLKEIFAQVSNLEEANTRLVSTEMEKLFVWEKAAIAKFGTLAKQIIAEPVVNNFKGVTKGDLSDLSFANILNTFAKDYPDLGAAMNAKYDELEFAFRFVGGDSEGAKANLTAALEKETSSNNTDWRTLSQLHDRLYGIACQDNDWLTALQHLEKQQEIQRERAEPREVFWLQTKFALAYDNLQRPSEAGRRMLNAREIAETMGDNELSFSAQYLGTQLNALERYLLDTSFLSMGPGKLTPVEKSKLRTMIKEAKEIDKQHQDLDKALEDARRLIARAQGVLAEKQSAPET